jgi:hypothetical protein
MTTVYFHIGTPKTGTTSIQKFLFDNREKLLEKRYLYPLTGIQPRHRFSGNTAGHYNHHNLFWALTKDQNKVYDPNAGGWEDLQREINSVQPEYVIISAEGFFRKKGFNSNQLSLVRDYLSRYETRIIVYLRRQDDWLQSLYGQQVKSHGYGGDIDQIIVEEKGSLDYYNMLEPWKNLFGKENIVVKIYEEERLNDGLNYGFLKSIGVNVDDTRRDFQNSEPHNISPSIKSIKIMRVLNKVLGDQMSNYHRKLKKLYFKYLVPDTLISRFISNLPESLISNELLSIEERVNIMKEFEESNRKVAQEYLGREDGTLFDPMR